jgi:prophage regulatory protein
MAKKLERLRSVQERTGLCTSMLYKLMREGTFPKNFPIGRQARAWDSDEVDDWIKATIAAGRKSEAA